MPDLVTFGKVMGGGFPAAAFGGRADVMAQPRPRGAGLPGRHAVGEPGRHHRRPGHAAAGHRRGLRPPHRPRARRSRPRPTEALAAAGVPHACSPPARCSRCSSPTGPGPRLRRRLRARTPRRTPPSSTRCSTRGVYLPPSAYEAWFLSAAHDDRAVQTVLDALPAAARAAAAASRGRPMTQSRDHAGDHRRPPAAPRRGAQPRRRALRPPRPASTSPTSGGRWPRRSPTPSRTATSPTCGPRRWSARRRPAAPLADALGARDRHRRAGDRVDEQVRGQELRRRRRRAAQPVGLVPPVEPVHAVVGRALQGGRGADDRRRRTTRATPPAATRPSSSRTSCRSGSPGCTPRAGRFLHDPRNRQCTLCSLTSFHFVGDTLAKVTYSEPAGDLIPARDKAAPFSAGARPEEKRP